MENKKSTPLSKIVPVLFGFFVMGFCDIVGRASGYVQKDFGWTEGMTGFVPSMVFIWFLFLSIPVGVMMNKWGRKNTVLLSMIVTVVGMLLPLVLYNSVTCMTAFAFLGIGNTILQVSLNPLLGNVITNKKLLTSSLTAGQVIKAISSFVGPTIITFAVAKFSNWYYCFPILGAITIISGIWILFTSIEREKVETGSVSVAMKETFSLLKDKTILLLFLGIFFVVGVDVATNFISSKLYALRAGISIDDSSADIAPQTYFICRTIGAFIGAFLMTKIAEIKYFRWNILLCIIVIVVMIFVENKTLVLVCVGAIGFLCSCIFSIIYSMAIQARPDKTNLISGLMITAIAGGAAVTPLMGAVSSPTNYTGGVCVILACVLYLTYCAFGIKTAKTNN